MIIATAGHIDHGKTALVKALTGVDTDRLPEEKSRGLTIDLGFAYHSVKEGPVIGFVDVPGHERFVRNMLAGVGGIDLALLIVAVDDGPMPQTLEHLAILDLLGVSQGVIALTKTDKVDAARVDEVSTATKNVLAGTSLHDAPFFEISVVADKGVNDLRAHLETIARQHQLRSSQGEFRLAIDRCFSVAGAGVVVTGTAFAGSVSTGDRLVLSPSGTQVRVRSIHAQNKDNDTGKAGQRLGINISGAGLSKTTVHRGQWLLSKNIHRPTRRIDVRIRLLPGEVKKFRHWTGVHAHMGAAEVTARVALLQDTTLAPGESALGQLVLDEELGALYGDRFILRDHSAQRTIGGGYVIDPFPPRRGRAKPERIAVLQALDNGDHLAALQVQLEISPMGVVLGRFQQSRNLSDEFKKKVVQDLDLIEAGSNENFYVFTQDQWRQLQQQALDSLQDAHQRWPDRPGLAAELLRRETASRIDPAVFQSLLDQLIAEKQIQLSGAYYHLPTHRAQMSDGDKQLWKKVELMLQAGRRKPPLTRQLASQLRVHHDAMLRFLARMQRRGLLYKVASNRFYLPATMIELATEAVALGTENHNGELTVINYRDRVAVGRNLSVEILEFFDQVGLTKRVGDSRQVIGSVSGCFPDPN